MYCLYIHTNSNFPVKIEHIFDLQFIIFEVSFCPSIDISESLDSQKFPLLPVNNLVSFCLSKDISESLVSHKFPLLPHSKSFFSTVSSVYGNRIKSYINQSVCRIVNKCDNHATK